MSSSSLTITQLFGLRNIAPAPETSPCVGVWEASFGALNASFPPTGAVADDAAEMFRLDWLGGIGPETARLGTFDSILSSEVLSLDLKSRSSRIALVFAIEFAFCCALPGVGTERGTDPDAATGARTRTGTGEPGPIDCTRLRDVADLASVDKPDGESANREAYRLAAGDRVGIEEVVPLRVRPCLRLAGPGDAVIVPWSE